MSHYNAVHAESQIHDGADRKRAHDFHIAAARADVREGRPGVNRAAFRLKLHAAFALEAGITALLLSHDFRVNGWSVCATCKQRVGRTRKSRHRGAIGGLDYTASVGSRFSVLPVAPEAFVGEETFGFRVHGYSHLALVFSRFCEPAGAGDGVTDFPKVFIGSGSRNLSGRTPSARDRQCGWVGESRGCRTADAARGLLGALAGHQGRDQECSAAAWRSSFQSWSRPAPVFEE